MAKEHIEREAVVKELEEHLSYESPSFTKEQNECIDTGLKIARRIVKALPAADVVEVVRCKDCVYFEEDYVYAEGFVLCPAIGMEVTDMDFCSYGERRDSDG